jgi:hypothetical protein
MNFQNVFQPAIPFFFFHAIPFSGRKAGDKAGPVKE